MSVSTLASLACCNTEMSVGSPSMIQTPILMYVRCLRGSRAGSLLKALCTCNRQRQSASARDSSKSKLTLYTLTACTGVAMSASNSAALHTRACRLAVRSWLQRATDATSSAVWFGSSCAGSRGPSLHCSSCSCGASACSAGSMSALSMRNSVTCGSCRGSIRSSTPCSGTGLNVREPVRCRLRSWPHAARPANKQWVMLMLWSCSLVTEGNAVPSATAHAELPPAASRCMALTGASRCISRDFTLAVRTELAATNRPAMWASSHPIMLSFRDK
mmetsp:Transcript_36997/g.93299  ORF Transcript_36997/g.93299 Transcript_36997/m.93299 type:complete len:274 (+) Transcript_36997:620-1441(+)